MDPLSLAAAALFSTAVSTAVIAQCGGDKKEGRKPAGHDTSNKSGKAKNGAKKDDKSGKSGKSSSKKTAKKSGSAADKSDKSGKSGKKSSRSAKSGKSGKSAKSKKDASKRDKSSRSSKSAKDAKKLTKSGSGEASGAPAAPVKMQMQPAELRWKAIGGMQNIQIHNNGAEKRAIKIKCSDNLLYRVNPVYATVEPGKAVKVDILRQNGGAKVDKIVVCTTKASAEAPKECFAGGAPQDMMVLPLLVAQE